METYAIIHQSKGLALSNDHPTLSIIHKQCNYIQSLISKDDESFLGLGLQN